MSVLTFAALSHAQTTTTGAPAGLDATGWNAQLFRPAMDSATTWWTTTTATPTSFGPGGSLTMHHADTPLAYQRGDGTVVNVVGGVSQLDAVGWLGGDRWRLGVDAPIVLRSGSDLDGTQAGFGVLGVEGKGVLLRSDEAVNLGVTGRVDLPTSTLDGALAARATGWELAGVVDHAFGPALLAANVGVRGMPETRTENARLNDFFVLRGAATYALGDGFGLSLDATAMPALSIEVVDPVAVPAEWTAGGWFPLGERFAGRAGFGTGLSTGVGAPDWRLLLGVSTTLATVDEDTDGDGLVDRADPCMTEPEDLDGVRDDDGCPELPPRLFVRVVDDTGAEVDGARAELVDAAGAAVELPLDDTVEVQPGAWTVKASAAGHEPGNVAFDVPPDADGHVTVLVRLEPVRLATLVVKVVGPDGQPLAGGRIGTRGQELGDAPGWEGPLAPGAATINARVKGYKPGQADVVLVAGETAEVVIRLEPAKAELANNRIELKESVFFELGKATIQERSFALLQEVADVMAQYPQIQVLRVEGHTDSRGAAAANLELSKKRAAAVRDWLVAHGVAKERVESEGFGETKPLDAREVAEAWEKNRRVDMVVAKWVDAPAPAEPAPE